MAVLAIDRARPALTSKPPPFLLDERAVGPPVFPNRADYPVIRFFAPSPSLCIQVTWWALPPSEPTGRVPRLAPFFSPPGARPFVSLALRGPIRRKTPRCAFPPLPTRAASTASFFRLLPPRDQYPSSPTAVRAFAHERAPPPLFQLSSLPRAFRTTTRPLSHSFVLLLH